MPNDQSNKPKLGAKALEMIMRDVLDGMEELAILKSYQTGGGIMEVISVNPPAKPQAPSTSDDDNTESESPTHAIGADVVSLHHFRLRRAG